MAEKNDEREQVDEKPVNRSPFNKVLIALFIGFIAFGLWDYYEYYSSKPTADYQAYKLWNRVWFSLDGALRSEYSEPAGERLRAAVDHVLARAREEGFLFSEPVFFQTTAAYHDIVPLVKDAHGGDPVMGKFILGAGKILISAGYMEQLNDKELLILVAHELGHYADFSSERLGHILFRLWRRQHIQMFADSFAAALYGSDAVTQFNEQFVYERPTQH